MSRSSRRSSSSTPGSTSADRRGCSSRSSPRRPRRGLEIFQRTEDGGFLAPALTEGPYVVVATADGFAPSEAEVDVQAGLPAEIEVVLEGGDVLRVRVVDGATGAPVEGARVTAATPFFLPIPLAAGRTDADGEATLGPLRLPDPSDNPMMAMFSSNSSALEVRAQHPDYAPVGSEVSDPSVAVELVFPAPARLHGRVHEAGRPPTLPTMVSLDPRGRDFRGEMDLPWMTLADAEGYYSFPRVGPGSYRIEVFERFLDGDLLGLLRRDVEPDRLVRENVELESGEVRELDFDISPGGGGPTAQVRGTVRIHGAPFEGARVQVRGDGSGRTARVLTNAAGWFESGPVAAGQEVRIWVEAELEMPGGESVEKQLYNESVDLAPGDVHEITVEFDPVPVVVRVVDEVTGDAVAGCYVQLSALTESASGDGASTDPDGLAKILVSNPGTYAVAVYADDYINATREITVPASGLSEPVLIGVDKGVTLSGRIEISGGLAAEEIQWAYIWVRQVLDEGGQPVTSSAQIDDSLTFELDGLVPGKYRCNMYVNGNQSEETEVVVGPAGESGVVLTFVLSGD